MNILEAIKDYHTKNIRLVRRIAHRDIETVKRHIHKIIPHIKIEIQKKPENDK